MVAVSDPLEYGEARIVAGDGFAIDQENAMALIDLGQPGLAGSAQAGLNSGRSQARPAIRRSKEILPWDGDEVQYEDEEQDEA